jgi:hypothetical protein
MELGWLAGKPITNPLQRTSEEGERRRVEGVEGKSKRQASSEGAGIWVAAGVFKESLPR